MPDLEYLLESTDPLNVQESIDACVLALQKGQLELVRKWLGEPGKLACTEAMGDAVKPFDCELALAVYLRSHAPHKVIQCYAETGQFDKIVQHSQVLGYVEEDYIYLLQSILGSKTAEQGLKLAKRLITIRDQNSGQPTVRVQAIVDVFVKSNLIGPCLEFLLQTALKSDSKADGALQTQLFQLYFAHDATAAKKLLDSKRFSFFDQRIVAQLCERFGYLQSAVELFKDHIADIRRVFASKEMAKMISDDWVYDYLESLQVVDAVQCLESSLTANLDQANRVAVARIAAELFRGHFSKGRTVETLHNVLKLDREILQSCQDAGWEDEHAQFLLRVKNPQLWSTCLTAGISTREVFIAQVTAVALDGDAEAIACLVKALMTASLSTDLMVILESLLFESNYDSRSLRNLLILTAIKLASASDSRSRVMDYAMRLDDYDGIEVAKMAESQQLFEEAFAIFRKFRDFKSAMRVLLDKIGDLDRAREFAKECNDPAIWALLPPPTPPLLQEKSDVGTPDVEPTTTAIVAVADPPPESSSPPHPVDTLSLPMGDDLYSPGVREEILLSEMAVKSPPPPIKASRRNNKQLLPPIKPPSNKKSGGGLQLAELASKVKIKPNARHVLQMTNDDIRRWLVEIGLGQFSDRFARYNGQMLDNLYSLHFTAPEFFCQSVNTKLDHDLDNVIVFFGGLCRLYGDQR